MMLALSVTNNAEDSIRQLRCHMEAGQMRLTFLWPEGVEQVYIFKTAGAFNIEEASAADGKLFTVQEYKKQGGYVEPRPSGAFSYSVFPFVRKGGEDVVVVYKGDGEKNTIEVTGQIPIQFSIAEKTSLFSRSKVYTVTLLAQQSLPGDVLCYVKKAGGYPGSVGDGTVYFFGNSLAAGVAGSWEIKTKKNEYIRVFVRDPGQAGVYLLRPF